LKSGGDDVDEGLHRENQASLPGEKRKRSAVKEASGGEIAPVPTGAGRARKGRTCPWSLNDSGGEKSRSVPV